MFARFRRGLSSDRPRNTPLLEEADAASASPFAKDEELSRRTGDYLARLEAGEYDFVDLGTCDGGGFTIAQKLGGSKGLGFDLEPAAVRRALAKGLDVALYDVCELATDAPHVDFAVCSHVFEHLPNLREIQRVLGALLGLCRDFVIISGPLFEHEDYLLGLGLKALHSLMLDHTCKMKVGDLQQMLHVLGRRDYVVALTERLEDSANHWIYSAKQTVPPEGLWTYDPSKHLAKPAVAFDRSIHRDFVCVVPLNANVRVDEVLSRFYWGYERVVVRSEWSFHHGSSD